MVASSRLVFISLVLRLTKYIVISPCRKFVIDYSTVTEDCQELLQKYEKSLDFSYFYILSVIYVPACHKGTFGIFLYGAESILSVSAIDLFGIGFESARFKVSLEVHGVILIRVSDAETCHIR